MKGAIIDKSTGKEGVVTATSDMLVLYLPHLTPHPTSSYRPPNILRHLITEPPQGLDYLTNSLLLFLLSLLKRFIPFPQLPDKGCRDQHDN